MRRRDRGVVIVISLLALVLLAALLAFVLDMGWQTSHRIVGQNAADATAMGGATWVARSFNTVALDNIAISRYLALVNTMDALPLATVNALNEQTVALAAVNRELPLALGSGPLSTVANAQFAILQQELVQEVGMLTNLNSALQAANVPSLTQYNTGSGHGQFWQAMQSLDELSQATLTNMGAAAQTAASTGGRADMPQANEALLLPAAPQVPWKRGTFTDFQAPVTKGQLPPAVDDKQYNRGPYDAVYGWRHLVGHFVQTGPATGSGTPGTLGVSLGGASDPFGGTPQDGGSPPKPPGYMDWTGYDTYGTQGYTLGQIRNFAYGGTLPNLDRSRFFPWLPEISNTKMGYIWNGTPPQYFSQPVWDTTYPTPEPPGLALSETLFLRLSIKSRYPVSSPAFMANSGTWYFSENPAPTPASSFAREIRQGGWWLPAPMLDPTLLTNQNNIAVASVGKLAWLFEMNYTVLSDPQLGITEQFDGNGNPIPQSAYFVQVVIYAGVNRNLVRPGVNAMPQSTNDVLIGNPYAGLDPTSSSAPAPTDLDHSAFPNPPAADPNNYLSFLGIVSAPDTPPVLGTRSDQGRAFTNQVTLAQAHVFNDHSWDLWTPMWHAQLAPVQGYENWMGTLQQTDPSSLAPADISAEDLTALTQYLQSMTTLAPVVMTH